MNFLRFDPSYKGVGLKAGGRGDKAVWDAFAKNPEHLKRVADAIVLGYQTDMAPVKGPTREEDELKFPEGKILYRIHRTYDRNQRLIKLAKEREMDMVRALRCGVCRFDFADRYGRIGHRKSKRRNCFGSVH